MAILREKQTWRMSASKRRVRPGRLTPEQAANVRGGIRALRVRFGSLRKLAAAMPMPHKSLEHTLYGPRQPTAGHALRVAQLAGVPVDDVLSGAFPEPGMCPLCGRGTSAHS